MNQDLENLKETIHKIKSVDDYILSQTDNLHIVLLNLKIESARLSTKTLDPIIDELDKAMVNINTKVKELIENNRSTLVTSIKNIETSLKEGELS